METQISNHTISYKHFLGSWKNSRPETKGIESYVFEESDEGLQISVRGAEDGVIPGNWGTQPVICHASSPEGGKATAFQAGFLVNGHKIFIAGNINKGLIIIAIYIEAGEADANSFIREFFYKS